MLCDIDHEVLAMRALTCGVQCRRVYFPAPTPINYIYTESTIVQGPVDMKSSQIYSLALPSSFLLSAAALSIICLVSVAASAK